MENYIRFVMAGYDRDWERKIHTKLEEIIKSAKLEGYIPEIYRVLHNLFPFYEKEKHRSI